MPKCKSGQVWDVKLGRWKTSSKSTDKRSLKQAEKDPEYGYGQGKVSRIKGKSDPRFAKGRRTDASVKKAIKADKSLRKTKSRRRKIDLERKGIDKPYSQTAMSRVKPFKRKKKNR